MGCTTSSPNQQHVSDVVQHCRCYHGIRRPGLLRERGALQCVLDLVYLLAVDERTVRCVETLDDCQHG